MKIERQLGIISYLMDQQKTTTKELSEKFDVSVRTIMRDIDDLTLAGIPFYTSPGKGGGIFISESSQLNKPPITENERAVIESSLKSRYQVLGDNSTFNAILKLNRVNQDTNFEIDLSLSKGNIELRTIVFKLLDSINKSQTVEFEYINSKGEVSRKRCEPYRVVYKDRSWYFDGYDLSTDEFGVYKIARMTSLVVEESFVKREFIPKPYDGEGWIHKDKVFVIVHINKMIIDRFIEIHGRSSLREIDDNWFEYQYYIHDNVYGYNTLLAYGKFIKIISPASYISNYTKYIEEIMQQYK